MSKIPTRDERIKELLELISRMKQDKLTFGLVTEDYDRIKSWERELAVLRVEDEDDDRYN